MNLRSGDAVGVETIALVAPDAAAAEETVAIVAGDDVGVRAELPSEPRDPDPVYGDRGPLDYDGLKAEVRHSRAMLATSVRSATYFQQRPERDEARMRSIASTLFRLDALFALYIPTDPNDDEWIVSIGAIASLGRRPVRCVGRSLDEVLDLTLSYLKDVIHE